MQNSSDIKPAYRAHARSQSLSYCGYFCGPISCIRATKATQHPRHQWNRSMRWTPVESANGSPNYLTIQKVPIALIQNTGSFRVRIAGSRWHRCLTGVGPALPAFIPVQRMTPNTPPAVLPAVSVASDSANQSTIIWSFGGTLQCFFEIFSTRFPRPVSRNAAPDIPEPAAERWRTLLLAQYTHSNSAGVVAV